MVSSVRQAGLLTVRRVIRGSRDGSKRRTALVQMVCVGLLLMTGDTVFEQVPPFLHLEARAPMISPATLAAAYSSSSF